MQFTAQMATSYNLSVRKWQLYSYCYVLTDHTSCTIK